MITDLERLGRHVGEQRRIEPPSEMARFLADLIAGRRKLAQQNRDARAAGWDIMPSGRGTA